MAEDKVDFSVLNSQINKLVVTLRRAAGESEKSARADEELSKEKKKLAQQASKAAQHIRQSTATVETMNRAQTAFKNELVTVSKKFRESAKPIEEQKIYNERLKRSLGLYSNTILGTIAVAKGKIELAKREHALSQAATAEAAEALRLQQNKNAALQEEYNYLKDRLTRAGQEVAANQELLGINEQTIAYNKSQMAVAAREHAAVEQKIAAINEATAALEKEAASSKDLERYITSQIKAATDEVQASKEKVEGYHATEAAQKAEIDAINKQIRELEKRGEFKGRGKQTGPTKEELALVETLKKREASILAAFEDTKKMRAAEQEYGQSILAGIPEMEADKQKAQEATSAYESAIAHNNSVLAEEGAKRTGLIESLGNMYNENEALQKQNEGLKTEIAQQQSGVKNLTKMLVGKAKALKDGIDAETGLTSALKDRTEEEATKKDEAANTEVSGIKETIDKLNAGIGKFVKALDDMIGAVRKTQQQFGIAAGQAAQLKIDNLVSSFKSFATSVLTLGKKAGVTAQEIENAQAAFQAEFGGVITSGAAENIARQAKEMGVGAGELAKARRVFMTQTMGNAGQAAEQQDKFINEFKKKGLTAKDAMAAIGQNSELLARNGTRFATSFARAAAEAKKIGVDLSKVDQVGDNIIGDFEGFLEKQAELGAMGFGFDSNRLAEVAETGDTGALFNELRSQLAATGKDITKLRRSEQLALSGAFGISMEELQRMAGPGGGSGEELTDQEKSNKFLEQLVNLGEAAAKGLGLIAGILSGTQTILLTDIARSMRKMTGGFGNFDKATGRGPASGTPGTATSTGAAAAPSRLSRMAGGAKIGAAGGALTGVMSGIAEYQESGDIKKALGRGLANMAGSVIGGALGSLIPIPGVGTMLGATAGGFAANWLFDKVFGAADDLMSKPGYGDRTLVTPTHAIALNNNDNIVAYADDLMATSAGLQFGALGQFAPQAPAAAPVNNINVDLSKLEAKLDAVVRAIGSMDVKLDGNKVGQVIVANDQKAATAGVFRAQRL